MAKLSFETLSFKLKEKVLQVTLLRIFQTAIALEDIEEQLGEFELPDINTISFPKFGDDKQAKVELLFSQLLAESFEHLVNKINKNKTYYIHKNSGIPLIGNVAFGIVYRDSSIIEIKPITSCNLNCIYCSVGEGLESKKYDFVVEESYIIQELENLLKFINEPVEIHVGVQGEPFLYADMEYLLADLQKMDTVAKISVDTNGTLLSKEIIDRVAKHDKLRFNFSLDAIDEELAKKMAGVDTYNVKHVQEMIKYASEKMKEVLVAPLVVPGYNEKEIEKVIQFIKTLKNQPILGIQNFLNYKTGRNPVKAKPWQEFYAWIKELELKYDIKLKLHEEDFGIHKTKSLPKPFEMDDMVKATIKAEDRFPGACIAVARGRNISVPNCEFKKDKKIRIKLTRDKHNVFVGKLVS
ncbi:MAG: radical SAM protein [archaeon]|nr:radical SAM protein [Nanoarchaeota archaeon]